MIKFTEKAERQVPAATMKRPAINGILQPFFSRKGIVRKIAEQVNRVSADCGKPAAVVSEIHEK